MIEVYYVLVVNDGYKNIGSTSSRMPFDYKEIETFINTFDWYKKAHPQSSLYAVMETQYYPINKAE